MSDGEEETGFGDEDAGEDMGLAPASVAHGTDILDLSLLKRRDEEFEQGERERGRSEECIEAGKTFCFLCVYGDHGEAGSDKQSRSMLSVVRAFSQFVRQNMATYTITTACIRIKTHYEMYVRQCVMQTPKPTFTHENIALHFLDHDASPENAMITDAQTHKIILNLLRKEMRTPEGTIDKGVLTLYLKTSSNFNKHYGADIKKRGGSGLS